MTDKILITIDKELIHRYNLEYLKKHPRSRNVPFAKKLTVKLKNKDGTPQLTKGGNQKTKTTTRTKDNYSIDDCLYGMMSLNELLVINNRMTMNGIKDKWGKLGEWIAKEFKLDNLQISNSLVEFRIYGETKASRDLDNISAGIKFLNDGLFVKSKMYIDDNYNHINPLITVGDYDKNLPRTEIRISIFDDEIKDVYEKMRIHIENWSCN